MLLAILVLRQKKKKMLKLYSILKNNATLVPENALFVKLSFKRLVYVLRQNLLL